MTLITQNECRWTSWDRKQCNATLGNAFTRPDMDLHPYFIYILGLVIGLHPTVNRMTLWVEQHSILSYNQTNQQYNIQYSIDRGNRVPCSDKTMIRELLSSLLRFEGLKPFHAWWGKPHRGRLSSRDFKFKMSMDSSDKTARSSDTLI